MGKKVALELSLLEAEALRHAASGMLNTFWIVAELEFGPGGGAKKLNAAYLRAMSELTNTLHIARMSA